MDPIQPIMPQPASPSPVAATPRVRPPGRDSGQGKGDQRRRRRGEREQDLTDAVDRDDGRPHIDVTA